MVIIVYLMSKASKLSRDESGKTISRCPFCVIFALSIVALVVQIILIIGFSIHL